MQQVINNLMYDTDKSIFIGRYEEHGCYTQGGPRHWVYELYKTKNNRFFEIRKCQNFKTEWGFLEFTGKRIPDGTWDIFLEPLCLGDAMILFEKLNYKNYSYEQVFDFKIEEA